LPDPQGQGSFLPNFSVSSLWPWTMRTPRFTFVSDGNPLRRLLIGSKKWPFVEIVLIHATPPFLNEERATMAAAVDTESWRRVRHKVLVIANPPRLDRVSSFMDTSLLDIKFARIGARLKVADRPFVMHTEGQSKAMRNVAFLD